MSTSNIIEYEMAMDMFTKNQIGKSANDEVQSILIHYENVQNLLILNANKM